MQTTYPATFLSILIFSQHILHTARTSLRRQSLTFLILTADMKRFGMFSFFRFKLCAHFSCKIEHKLKVHTRQQLISASLLHSSLPRY